MLEHLGHPGIEVARQTLLLHFQQGHQAIHHPHFVEVFVETGEDFEPVGEVVIQPVFLVEVGQDSVDIIVEGHSHHLDAQGCQLLCLGLQDALGVHCVHYVRHQLVYLFGVVLQHTDVQGGCNNHVIVTFTVRPYLVDAFHSGVQQEVETLPEQVLLLQEGCLALLNIVFHTPQHHFQVVSAPTVFAVFQTSGLLFRQAFLQTGLLDIGIGGQAHQDVHQ